MRFACFLNDFVFFCLLARFLILNLICRNFCLILQDLQIGFGKFNFNINAISIICPEINATREKISFGPSCWSTYCFVRPTEFLFEARSICFRISCIRYDTRFLCANRVKFFTRFKKTKLTRRQRQKICSHVYKGANAAKKPQKYVNS
jgi:hypothetical protein